MINYQQYDEQRFTELPNHGEITLAHQCESTSEYSSRRCVRIPYFHRGNANISHLVFMIIRFIINCCSKIIIFEEMRSVVISFNSQANNEFRVNLAQRRSWDDC